VAVGRPPRLTTLAQARHAVASRRPARPVLAVVVTPVAPGPPVPATVTGALLEVLGILSPHVPGGQNNDDEDNDDNYRQANHKFSHRTIHNGMASQCGASEAHAAIDAGLTQ